MRRFLSDAIATNPIAPLTGILGLIVLALVLQSSSPINHDVSWLLLATRRLLDGSGVFVNDVVEVNPPLILYLFVPPVVLGRVLELSEVTAIRVYVTIWILGCLFLSARLLPRCLDTSGPWLRGTLLVVIAYLISFVDYEFGQREHFMLVLLIPYLLALAARGRGASLASGEALAIGFAGGLAISLKPHYLLALAALELGLAIRRRSLRSLRRPELLALVTLGLTYLVSLPIATPGYLQIVLPLARDTYWAYQESGAWEWDSDSMLLALAALGFLALQWRSGLRPLAEVLLIAAAGFYIAFLIQATGYRYQLIPFRATASLLIALALLSWVQGVAGPYLERWLPETGRAPSVMRRLLGASLCALILPSLLLCTQPNLRIWLGAGGAWRAGETDGKTAEILAMVDRHAPGGSFYILSIFMVPTFPAVSYAGTDWPSRFSHLWILPAVIRARAGDPRVPAHIRPERIDELEHFLRDAVVDDLERNEPELILLDRSLTHRALGRHRVDLAAWFLKDPRFQAIWSEYEIVRVYLRWAVARRRFPSE